MKKEILKKIERQEIQMKPKWWFELLRAMGWVTTLAFVLMSAFSLVVSIILGRVKIRLEYLEFGDVGRELVWESVPWWWLVGFGILFVLGMVLYERRGTNYRLGANMRLLRLLVWLAGLTIGLWLLRYLFDLEVLTWLI